MHDLVAKLAIWCNISYEIFILKKKENEKVIKLNYVLIFTWHICNVKLEIDPTNLILRLLLFSYAYTIFVQSCNTTVYTF